jgi:hypothetical protein
MVLGVVFYKIFCYGYVDVRFLLRGRAVRGPPRGVGCGLHSHHLLGRACGVGRLPVENMCVVRVHIVWFVVPMGVFEKTDVLLTCLPRSCCMGWRGVFVSPFL